MTSTQQSSTKSDSADVSPELRTVEHIRPLILAGGLSSRMGRPKHLLQLPNGDTLLEHIVKQVTLACPWTDTVYVSLRHTGLAGSISSSMVIHGKQISIELVYDNDDVDEDGDEHDDRVTQSQGPAAGMIAAHQSHPTTTLLVIACDFPLLDAADVQSLLSAYRPPVTCYQNDQGFYEPLFGVWSSVALEKLAENAKTGSFGPSRVVKELAGHAIRPRLGREMGLFNANTPAEWQEALGMIDG